MGSPPTDAIAQLNEEYQDQLEKKTASMPHGYQEIKPNDGNYAIARPDLLAAFAAYTSRAVVGSAGLSSIW